MVARWASTTIRSQSRTNLSFPAFSAAAIRFGAAVDGDAEETAAVPAELDFGPLLDHEGQPLTCHIKWDDWGNMLSWIRTAFALCNRDRADLTRATREMYDDDQDLVINIIRNCDEIHGVLQVMSAVLRTAYYRTMFVGELVEDERLAGHVLLQEAKEALQ
jgi:hypothetical protein